MSTPKSKTISACPQCQAELNAIVRLNLYNVTVVDGILTHYEGGPTPDSDSAIVEICEPSNTIIFCEAGHLLNDPTTPIDPLHTLELIAQCPANSNSEPDTMGQALEEITTLASNTLQRLVPRQTIPFQVGHGYNSKQTGDYYIFTGPKNGLYAFYRPSTASGPRLTPEEAEACFDHRLGRRETHPDDSQAASEWHKSLLII
jgi:hypothetical protein